MDPGADDRFGLPVPVVRLILGVLGAIQATDGLYALFAPRSFYDDFPLGRGWVEALPAYNEHLLRDVGGLFLATAVVLIAAAIWLDRRLVLVACVSFLAFAIPHTTWHFFNLGPYGTFDTVANVIALSFMVVGPLVILVGMARAGSRT
jgi:hypothetical protein